MSFFALDEAATCCISSTVSDGKIRLMPHDFFEYNAALINREPVEPRTSGGLATWELQNLPWIEREDHSPTLSAMAPRIVVSYFPPANNSAGLRGLRDWAAVSSWLAALIDPAAAANDLIRAKAAQLTANATAEIEKIRAIASFVKQTKYVAVSLNLTRGGGYTPRRSDEVLAKNYGDCKDKASLMHAMLEALGIDSRLVLLRTRRMGNLGEAPASLARSLNPPLLKRRRSAGCCCSTQWIRSRRWVICRETNKVATHSWSQPGMALLSRHLWFQPRRIESNPRSRQRLR